MSGSKKRMGSDQLVTSSFKLVGTERGSKVRGVEAFTALQDAFPFQNNRFYEPPASSMDSVGIEPLVDGRGELDELEQAKIMLMKHSSFHFFNKAVKRFI
jgi:hypothetical protein